MRILFAEDDLSIQAITVLALTRVGKHEVLSARNGIEVLDICAKQTPDLILLDVMMPKLDGFETCRRLKENPVTRRIPVIFLTAKAQANEIHHGMHLGAQGYILKPFDPMTLHEQIQEVLKNSEKAA
jgi:two-component system, OmpR family, response regulator